MGDPATMALITLSAGSTAGSIYSQLKGGEEQRTQIKTQMSAERMAAAERSEMRIGKIQQVLAGQEVRAAASNLSLAGSSVKALAIDSYDKFNEDENAEALNLSFKQSQLESQLQRSRMSEWGGIFESFGNVVKQLGQGSIGGNYG